MIPICIGFPGSKQDVWQGFANIFSNKGTDTSAETCNSSNVSAMFHSGIPVVINAIKNTLIYKAYDFCIYLQL